MLRRGNIQLCALIVCLFLIPFVVGGQQSGKKVTLTGLDRLKEVATNNNQWTGIAVSSKGRVFVNFPRWSPNTSISVGELESDGTVTPYPDVSFNDWVSGDDPSTKFVCVQSVYIDSEDRLWILDPANAMFQGVVAGGAKLMQVDISENKIVQTIYFDDTIAPKQSYLNDVRIDTNTETAFITDSGAGALVMVSLDSGKSRRVLDNHPSTKAENTTVSIGGIPIDFVVHSDGIAFDQKGGWLYYQALTGRTLYRVSAQALRDETLKPEQLASKVETFAKSGVSDGLLYSSSGIYLSSLEDGAIKIVDFNGRVSTVVKDDRIVWPDSFAHGPDGSVWFTTSQIHLGPNPSTPYRVLKVLPKKK